MKQIRIFRKQIHQRMLTDFTVVPGEYNVEKESLFNKYCWGQLDKHVG